MITTLTRRLQVMKCHSACASLLIVRCESSENKDRTCAEVSQQVRMWSRLRAQHQKQETGAISFANRMKNMQKKRQENRRERSRKISAIRPRWCKVKAGRVFASTACISLALAACGGNSGDDAAVPTLPIAEGAAAPDAASSGDVSLNQKALVSISGLQT